MITESEFVELKEVLNDNISKEVVAFANTQGGEIYVGIDNKGNKVGIKNLNETYTKLTNIIRDSILPDVTLFTKYELQKDNVIKISVTEGTAKPYYLKKNGMKPSGVYVRQGTSSVGATWEQIRQLIKHTDGDSFESARSILQDLTFDTAEKEFRNRDVLFREDKYISLGLRSYEKNLYTNLAHLFSDQCIHSVKIAVFDDPDNTIFKDRREFSGSIFKQLHQTYEYLMLNNRTASIIHGLDRIDKIEYPTEALREALLNALIHRDYSYSGSIIININNERMEFISIGGLPRGLSTSDIMNGISQPRNPMLAQAFFRLKHMESYGTGIRRIFNLYNYFDTKPTISVSENSFRITLPNMNYYTPSIAKASKVSDVKSTQLPHVTSQMQIVLDYLRQNQSLTEHELMELLHVKRTRAYIITKQMTELGLISIIGRGKGKKFVLPTE